MHTLSVCMPHKKSTIRTLASLLTLFSALVKTEEGLEEEKNSLPTDHSRNPVTTKPPTMTKTHVRSFPA